MICFCCCFFIVVVAFAAAPAGGDGVDPRCILVDMYACMICCRYRFLISVCYSRTSKHHPSLFII